jgi:hypothetical protein
MRPCTEYLIKFFALPTGAWDIESFMYPFHRDRRRLERGVWTFDTAIDPIIGAPKGWFKLRCHFVAVLADLPARTKAAQLVGHMGRQGCGQCEITGFTVGGGASTYYPIFRCLPEFDRGDFSPDDRIGLPAAERFPEMRTSASIRAAVDRLFGLEGESPWSDALYYDFASFYPIDMMHLYFCKFVPWFWKLLFGKVPGFENAWFVLNDDAKVSLSSSCW